MPGKIKILELLLYLEALELPKDRNEKPYFYSTQVEKVKAVQQFLIAHMDEHYTQEELSCRFDIPLTPLKNCFKTVFGASIGSLPSGIPDESGGGFVEDKEKDERGGDCRMCWI